MTSATDLTDALHASWTTGVLTRAPLKGLSLEEAYETQQHVFERREELLAGWKLGATSELAQERLGLSCPIAGRLAASDIFRAAHAVEAVAGLLYAEAELALLIYSDLPSRAEAYNSAEVASAVGPVYAAIELCTSRYVQDEVEAPALVADNVFAHKLVLGRMLAPGWNSRLASIAVTLDCGTARSVTGSAAAVMGNPLEAVVWLANWLSSRGEGLKRGQVIATGSCTGITQVHPGEIVRASFAGAEGATTTIVQSREK